MSQDGLASKGEPLRIQATAGSRVFEQRRVRAALPGVAFPSPKVVSAGTSKAPLCDLIFHGGKVMPQCEYQNIYLGSSADWCAADIAAVDYALRVASRHRSLDEILGQYFFGTKSVCEPRESLILSESKPALMGETDVQSKLLSLYDSGALNRANLECTLFNFVLPPKTVLTLEQSSSLDGLGGYHGSVSRLRDGRQITLYYSASVFSEVFGDGQEHGVCAFAEPWKNVSVTLFHQLCEFRTDPDVSDAVRHADNSFLGWMSRDGAECADTPIPSPLSSHEFAAVVCQEDQGIPIHFIYSNSRHDLCGR